MGLIALIGFWTGVGLVWSEDGPKIPLIFITLWVFGFLGFPLLQIKGPLFMSFEAILAIILFLIYKFKTAGY